MSMEIPQPSPRVRRPFLRGCAIVALVFVAFFVLIGIISRVDDWSLPTGNKVAVLPVTGLIADSESTIEQLRKFSKDDSVKAIVLRINSPGGGGGPSQEIYEGVGKLKGKKGGLEGHRLPGGGHEAGGGGAPPGRHRQRALPVHRGRRGGAEDGSRKGGEDRGRADLLRRAGEGPWAGRRPREPRGRRCGGGEAIQDRRGAPRGDPSEEKALHPGIAKGRGDQYNR